MIHNRAPFLSLLLLAWIAGQAKPGASFGTHHLPTAAPTSERADLIEMTTVATVDRYGVQADRSA